MKRTRLETRRKTGGNVFRRGAVRRRGRRGRRRNIREAFTQKKNIREAHARGETASFSEQPASWALRDARGGEADVRALDGHIGHQIWNRQPNRIYPNQKIRLLVWYLVHMNRIYRGIFGSIPR